MGQLQLSIVFVQETGAQGTMWVAQGLEYDIAAQGKTLKEAQDAFERAFVGQVIVNLHHGKEPMENVPAAPADFWHKFHEGLRLAERKPLFFGDDLPVDFPIRAITENRVNA